MTAIFIPGTLLVPSDNIAARCSLLSTPGGAILNPDLTAGLGDPGAMISSGTFAQACKAAAVDAHLSSIKVFDTGLVELADVALFAATSTWYNFSPVTSDFSATFYGCHRDITLAAFAQVKTFDSAGSIGATTYTLDVKPVIAMTVNRANTILYYADGTVGGDILAWDLVNDAALGTFVAGFTTNQWGIDMLTTAAGTILAIVQPDTGATAWEVREYSTAGALVFTYPLPNEADFGDNPHLSLDAGDATTFWARTFEDDPSDTLTTFTQFRLGAASPITQFRVVQGSTGSAIALSCPFFAWSAGSSPSPTIPSGHSDPIRILRQAPHLWDGASGHRLTYPGFQLLVESGSPRDTDIPLTFFLQWSDDGGHTWSNIHALQGSNLGQYRFRFWWRRLGQSRDRIFRVYNSDDAKIVLVDALLTPDPVEGSS